MKDSGIDWIGEIPEDWELSKIKFIFDEVKFTYFDHENTDLLSLTQKGLVRRDISNNEGQIAANYEKYIKVFKGYISLNPMDLITGWVDINEFEGMISPAYSHLRLKDGFKAHIKYLIHSFQICYRNKVFFSLGKGVASHSGAGRWTLSNINLQNFKIPLPPFDEQKNIAEYLDDKTDQIDSLIENIKKKIELLEEQRSALINQVVTKGLDPNVEMKDIGIEWIGEIPKHWVEKRLGMCGTFSKGKSITKNDLVDIGHPVILYTHLYTTYDRIVKDTKYFIEEDIQEKSVKIKDSTFMFTSSGELKEEIGKTLLYKGEKKCSVGG
ncbi:MAG: restriction endonuclease subunit S [Dehalococcoidia bacterium]